MEQTELQKARHTMQGAAWDLLAAEVAHEKTAAILKAAIERRKNSIKAYEALLTREESPCGN